MYPILIVDEWKEGVQRGKEVRLFLEDKQVQVNISGIQALLDEDKNGAQLCLESHIGLSASGNKRQAFQTLNRFSECLVGGSLVLSELLQKAYELGLQEGYSLGQVGEEHF